MIFFLAIILLFIGYSFLIFYYWQAWRSIPEFSNGNRGAELRISVVIPARNEEENIGHLLKALEAQTYPRQLFEVIVVDDHSADRTAEIVKSFQNACLISLTDEGKNSYKKLAVAKGIAAATGEWILCTDADCIPHAEWIETLVSFRNKTNAGFVVAPVVFNEDSRLVEKFQALDFMVLQGITGASVYKKVHAMCNGANLFYEKKLFHEVGGFSGIDHIASGDDMLLMYKIAGKYPESIHYLKSSKAIVSTRPMPGWRSFFNQRIRWASKARYYGDKKITAVLVLVYLFNLSFPALLTAGCVSPFFWYVFIFLWIGKTVVEWPFMLSLAKFFNKRQLLKLFFVFQPMHIFYTIVSGFLGQFGQYEWKGRRVK